MTSIAVIFILPVYAFFFMKFLLRVRLRDIPPKRLGVAGLLLLVVVVVNVFFFITQGRRMYGQSYFLLVHVPTIVMFNILSVYRGWRVIFAFLTAFFTCSFPGVVENVIRVFHPTGTWDDLIVYTLVCALMLWMVKKLFGEAFFYMLEYGERRDFAKFCVIPLFYFVSTFLLNGRSFQISNNAFELGVQHLPLLFTIFTYYLLLHIFRSTREKQVFKSERELAAMRLLAAEQRISQLKETQQQAAAYRHDMRHHVSLLKGYLGEGDLHKISDYLCDMERDLDAITPVQYCENETVNLVLCSFDARAKNAGVALYVDASLPEQLSVSDTELCALLSNALENAITAAAQVEDKKLRRVYLHTLVNDGKLLLSTENAYAGTIELEGELPKSQSREASHGFGVRSMVSIVERHGGLYSFETSDGVFVLQLMLPLEQ